MDFGYALSECKEGAKIARESWNAIGVFVALQVPDEHSKMTAPYLYLATTGSKVENNEVAKNLVPWMPSQKELLANDWLVVTSYYI